MNAVTKIHGPLIISIHHIKDIFVSDLVRYKTPEEEAKHLQTSFLSSKKNFFLKICWITDNFVSETTNTVCLLENKSLISMGILSC